MKLETLDTLLRLALIQAFHDKATTRKMTIKMAKKVHPSVKTMVIDNVLAASDPKAALAEHAFRFMNLNAAANVINGMGFIGMLVHEGIAYPVRVIIEDVHDQAYVIQNERTIAQKAAALFDEQFQVPRGKCEVQFFKNRGFTGTRFQVPVGA